MRRVCITGVGIICPLGRSLDRVWEKAMAGVSAVVPFTVKNAASGLPLTLPAAPLAPEDVIAPPKAIANMAGRFASYAWQSAVDAVADSGIDFTAHEPWRCGTAFGTHLGGLGDIEEQFNAIYLRGQARVHPFTVTRSMNNAPNAFLQSHYKISGPALTYSTTCSSSLIAIGEAARQIRHGYADVMLAGGADASLNHATLNGWHSAQLIAPIHDDPARSCRPFDATRSGTVLGEGAVFVVLETVEQALARGGTPYAELLGYCATADIGHMSQPSVEGQGRAMRLALADAGIDPAAIGYICAHGTATRLNDVTETRAIRAVFGAHAEQIAISSAKGAVGHMVGAAGAMGLTYSLKALQQRAVPATANLHEPDPECDLDYVPLIGRAAPNLEATLCNAFGFGGPAASVVLRRLAS